MLPAKADRAPRAPVIAARALTALVLMLAVAFAGCGDEDDDDEPATGATELTVTLDADGPGGQPARTETVACEATEGGSPCALLRPTDFAPLDEATPCTQLYGGPDEATVEGTVAGEAVAATLTRADGCAIELFDRFLPLLRELFPGYEPGASLVP